jgi:hypothetical protein
MVSHKVAPVRKPRMLWQNRAPNIYAERYRGDTPRTHEPAQRRHHSLVRIWGIQRQTAAAARFGGCTEPGRMQQRHFPLRQSASLLVIQRKSAPFKPEPSVIQIRTSRRGAAATLTCSRLCHYTAHGQAEPCGSQLRHHPYIGAARSFRTGEPAAFKTRAAVQGGMDHEENLPTEPSGSQAPPRLSRPHGDHEWAEGAGPPSS